jgi:hypothetical protein
MATKAARPVILSWDQYLAMVSTSGKSREVVRLGIERAALSRALEDTTERLRSAAVRLAETGQATAPEIAGLAGVHPDVMRFWLGKDA